MLGEEGVTQLLFKFAWMVCVIPIWFLFIPVACKAIDEFWEALKPTDFFQQHPILSSPATGQHL
jgi:hypothetical protein